MRYSTLLLILMITGCTSKAPELTVVKEVERLILVKPPKPAGLTLEVPTFRVITGNTCLKVYEETGPMFSLDALGYQQMARNIQEMRRYILELQNVIKFYEEAIEKVKNESDTR